MSEAHLPGIADLPLRDLHLPPEPGWWPPAPTWLLVFAALLLLGWAAVLLWRQLLRYRAHFLVLVALRAIDRERSAASIDSLWLGQLSQLIRRHALTVYPRRQVAGTEGEDWLDFLARTGCGENFKSGPGRWLRYGPYAPALKVPEADARELLQTLRKWVIRQPPARGKTC